MPSLLLQPLLENSLKYAVSAREQGGLVRIEGRTREGWLELSVIDDGPGLREGAPVERAARRRPAQHRERLAVLYGENCRFAVSQLPTRDCASTWRCRSRLAEAGPRAAVQPGGPGARAARGAHA